jgi:hypothetical protein
MKSLKMKMNIDMVNCTLLVIILVLVILCYINRNVENALVLQAQQRN